MRIIKIATILLFIVFMVAPTVQYFYPIVNVEIVNEKRERVAWPDEGVWAGLTKNAGYSSSAEKFFTDHFPLRDFMLRSLGQFEYSILGRSREVIIGEDGWLSDKKVLAKQLHQLDRVTDEKIKASILQLKQLQFWLQAKGVDFLMVIVPMKPTIYADKFPERYTERPKATGLQRFQKAMENNDIPFLDVLKILNEHKDETSLFYKTDMHWSTPGISYVAEAMVNHFSSKFIGEPIWNESIKKSEQEFSGKELATMPLLFPKPENTSKWVSENLAYRELVNEDIKSFSGTDKTRALLPPSIMFGNSFMLQYPVVGFHNYFSKSSRALDYSLFSKVLDYIKPEHKIMILHVYETQLLFHILPPDSFNYWDKRIQSLLLPVDFKYQ